LRQRLTPIDVASVSGSGEHWARRILTTSESNYDRHVILCGRGLPAETGESPTTTRPGYRPRPAIRPKGRGIARRASRRRSTQLFTSSCLPNGRRWSHASTHPPRCTYQMESRCIDAMDRQRLSARPPARQDDSMSTRANRQSGRAEGCPTRPSPTTKWGRRARHLPYRRARHPLTLP
jgi:hypothetical protein